jgi:lysozyme
MLDVEDQSSDALNNEILQDKAAFVQLITDWINIIQTATGRKVMIYSYKNFFNEYLNNASWPNNYLWLAAYQANPPGLPVGYQNWNFWQYSEYGTLGGATTGGSLDLDYFNGSLTDLAAL